ncbi:Solute carrier family 2 facilitated glucose transporter member 9, partial [Dissostichus eleginoides]
MVYCDLLQYIVSYCDLLQYIVGYCDLLQYIDGYCDLLQYIDGYCDLLQYIVGYCDLLQYIVGYCDLLQYIVGYCDLLQYIDGYCDLLQYIVGYCDLLQYIVGYCDLLQYIVGYCDLLQYIVGYCDLLQYIDGYCDLLQYIVGYCDLLQYIDGYCDLLIWFYTNDIFENAGIPAPEIQYTTAGTGIIEILAGLIGCFSIERLGRRPLMIGGFAMMGICSAGITLAGRTVPALWYTMWGAEVHLPFMRYISVCCVVGIIAGFCIGPAGVPFLITAELFKQSHRPAAYIVGGSLNWLSNFTVGFFFPFLQ